MAEASAGKMYFVYSLILFFQKTKGTELEPKLSTYHTVAQNVQLNPYCLLLSCHASNNVY